MFSELRERIESAGDAELRARLRELEGKWRGVVGEMALVLGEIEERKLHRDDSHASMWGLLRAELAWSDRDCWVGPCAPVPRVLAKSIKWCFTYLRPSSSTYISRELCCLVSKWASQEANV